MADNQTTKERLIYFVKSLGIGQGKFEKECGLSNGWVNNIKATIKDDKLQKIILRYPDLNDVWLMTGNGAMLRTESSSPSSAEQNVELSKKGVLMVPVMNLDARGGLLANQETDVAEYVTEMIPFSDGIAQKGDFVIPMYGDSMYPRYPSGSRLLIRHVESWRDYLDLGASYVIELVDGRRVVKIVKKGSDKDHFLLVSVNPEFEEQEIPKSIINHVFLVKLMLKNEVV